jgi:hypothetical protein
LPTSFGEKETMMHRCSILGVALTALLLACSVQAEEKYRLMVGTLGAEIEVTLDPRYDQSSRSWIMYVSGYQTKGKKLHWVTVNVKGEGRTKANKITLYVNRPKSEKSIFGVKTATLEGIDSLAYE